MSPSVSVRYSTQETVTTTTTTGVDANNAIKTSTVESVEPKAIPGQKIILGSVDFSSLNAKSGSSTDIRDKLQNIKPPLEEIHNKASETLQP
ncbi:MAG: hypothetical protein WCH65_06075 [bacterium]